MLRYIKKITISVMALFLVFTSTNISVFANTKEVILQPGEVTQKKEAKWADYGKGIAEISFDVVGMSAEEALDVAIVYDNSGSMQIANPVNGNYLASRWYYASTAAKTLSSELLKSKDNNVALIPFSDVLIDGNSYHTNPTDFFETHQYIYDENGNPDLNKMNGVASFYDGVTRGIYTLEEFYELCESVLQVTREEIVEGNNTQNAIVPLTNDATQINNAIDSLYPSNAGQTNYEVALRKAQSLLASSNNKKVIIMISDGAPNRGGDSVKVAQELKQSGVTIYTCGTGISDKDAVALKAIASKENNVPLYTSSNPSDLSQTLDGIRKKIGAAANEAVIEDTINTDYFEYYTDATHKPTVNGVAITDEEFVVSDDKSSITWNIGSIRETTKTLRFYVKVKDSLLNDTLLENDEALLNQTGNYATNKAANLTYKEVNSNTQITTGHEMESPLLEVQTATLKKTYYASDANGNYILENGNKVILKTETSSKKALDVAYEITPEQTIVVDGVTYHILREDNKVDTKTFTKEDNSAEFTYRYVKQLNVTFDTNSFGQFNDASVSKKVLVDHTSMMVSMVPNVENIPANMYFVGWNTAQEGTGDVFLDTTEIDKDITVYAQYAYHPVNVTFQDKDGNVYDQFEVEYDTAATAPTVPAKEGYTFLGWDKDFSNVKEDMVITSEFEANNYKVKFDGNGATAGTMEDQTFRYDEAENLNKNTFTKDNYTFTGWLYNGTVYADEAEIKNLIATVDGEVTFVAQWQENSKFTVSFQDENGNVLKTETVYEGSDAIAPTLPTRDGYIFKGWDIDFTDVKEDLLVTAIWEVKETPVVPPVQPTNPIEPNNPTQPILPRPIAPVEPDLPVTFTPTQPITPVTPIAPVAPVAPVAPTPVTPTPPTNDVVDQPEDPEVEVVEDPETPLANGVASSSWALINLLCSIATVLLVLVILLGKHEKEEEEEETVTYKRRRWTKVASVVVAFISAIAFILTEDMTLPMMFVDKWTILMIIILLIQVVVLVLTKKWKNTEDNMVTNEA